MLSHLDYLDQFIFCLVIPIFNKHNNTVRTLQIICILSTSKTAPMLFNSLKIKARFNTNALGCCLIVIILTLGLFFRFTNLEQKIYWYDEAFTSLRISGYTEEEVAQQVFNGQVIGLEELQKFQTISPEKSIMDTISGLAIEEPQVTPLYFMMARLWVSYFGNSISATRALSAVISLFALPCIYWLCRELFQSPSTGVMAALLVAISPYHVLYAQDARMYSLWTVTTLLSSLFFLQAIRLNDRKRWALYAIALVTGPYTHLLTMVTVFVHGLYLMIVERLRLSGMVINYLFSTLIGFLLFAPWFFTLVQGISQARRMTGADLSQKRSLWFIISS